MASLWTSLPGVWKQGTSGLEQTTFSPAQKSSLCHGVSWEAAAGQTHQPSSIYSSPTNWECWLMHYIEHFGKLSALFFPRNPCFRERDPRGAWKSQYWCIEIEKSASIKVATELIERIWKQVQGKAGSPSRHSSRKQVTWRIGTLKLLPSMPLTVMSINKRHASLNNSLDK